MGFFSRSESKRKRRESDADAGSETDAPSRAADLMAPAGPVSSVLNEPVRDDGDSPHGDIVERRFGLGAAAGRVAAAQGAESEPVVELDPDQVPTFDEPARTTEREFPPMDLEVDSMAHVGCATTITGDIVAREDLEIEGTVEGTVSVAEHRVTVGAEGVVKARVEAASVVVVGRIEGDVSSSERIEVRSGGYIGGNVTSPRVILQDGAIVIGGLDMSAAISDREAVEPPRDVSPAPATDVEPTSPGMRKVEAPSAEAEKRVEVRAEERSEKRSEKREESA